MNIRIAPNLALSLLGNLTVSPLRQGSPSITCKAHHCTDFLVSLTEQRHYGRRHKRCFQVIGGAALQNSLQVPQKWTHAHQKRACVRDVPLHVGRWAPWNTDTRSFPAAQHEAGGRLGAPGSCWQIVERLQRCSEGGQARWSRPKLILCF